MGIWTDQFLAPYEVQLPDVATFSELAALMIEFKVARAPWYLVAGNLSANAVLPYTGILGRIRRGIRNGSLTVGDEKATDTTDRIDWSDEPPPWGWAIETGRVLATGTEPADIAAAVTAAPYGHEDIAIVFDQLDFSNPDVHDHFWDEDSRIQLTCFALARPQSRPLATNSLGDPDGGPAHPVQMFVSVGFKHGYNVPCPAIAKTFVHVLGPGLVTGQTLS